MLKKKQLTICLKTEKKKTQVGRMRQIYSCAFPHLMILCTRNFFYDNIVLWKGICASISLSSDTILSNGLCLGYSSCCTPFFFFSYWHNFQAALRWLPLKFPLWKSYKISFVFQLLYYSWKKSELIEKPIVKSTQVHIYIFIEIAAKQQ